MSVSQERLSELELGAIEHVLNQDMDVDPHWVGRMLFEIKRLQAIEAEKDRYKAALEQVAYKVDYAHSKLAEDSFQYADDAIEILHSAMRICNQTLVGADTQ